MTGLHRRPDQPHDATRRRFLTGLVGLFGIGTIATLLRNRGFSAAPSTTTSSVTSQASVPANTVSSSSSTSKTTTTQGPTTTSTQEAPTTSAETTTTTTEVETTSTTQPTTVTTEAGPTTTQPATTVTTTPTAGAGLILLEKAAWGAQPEGAGFVGHSVTRITVHHTAVVLGSNSSAPARIRQHQNYHQSQGWPDIAYHVMIDKAGNLYEGRPLEFRGDTFTSYDPSGHFLPCLEGDYNTEVPTEVQMEALARVCAWAANRWSIDPSEISGHRDFAATSCPGGEVYDDISGGSLAARVAEIMESSVPTLSYLRSDAGAAVVASIEAGG